MQTLQVGNKPFADSAQLAAIKENLRQFIGTENYHRIFPGILCTDGIKVFADDTQCHWVISDLAVVSHLKFPRVDFQLWVLRVKDMVGELTMREDTNAPVLYRQNYKYTDFPEGTFVMYLRDGVLMLPSEY
jgi:hypothetical protein